MVIQGQPDGKLGGWGTPGAPLAPWWLREYYGQEPVEALSRDDALVRWEDLGPDWHEAVRIDLALVEPAVIAAAKAALEESPALRKRTLVPRGLTINRTEFHRISWKTRTFNVLRRERMSSDPSRLNSTTVGSALEWRQFGFASLIDLACGLEAISVPGWLPQIDGSSASLPATGPVHAAPAEEWMYHISVADPRVGVQGVPKLSTSLGEALERSQLDRTVLTPMIEVFRSTVESINQMPLMDSLEHYIRMASGLDDKRLRAVWARLGFASSGVATLAQAGEMAGVTRERIRQLLKKLEDGTESVNPLFFPKLDAALAFLESIAPTTMKRAEEGLRHKGLEGATVPGVLRAAEFFRRRPGVKVIGNLLLGHREDLDPESLRQSVLTAKRLARASAASNLDFLQDRLVEQGTRLGRDLLKHVLDGVPTIVRKDSWFWVEEASPHDRLANVARKVLAINQPQTVRSVREALRRRLAFKAIEPTPPGYIVSTILGRHPEFRVEDDLVYSEAPLEMSEVLGDLELAMVSILKESIGGVLTRPELMAACYDRGLNMHSVGVYTSYSPCLERVGPGIWAPRGETVDPIQVELAKERLGRVGDRPTKDGGWTPDGSPWFAFELTKSNIAGPVASVDPAIRAVLKGRNLPLLTQGGVDVGRLGFSDDGTSAWGFTRAISVLGGEPEDVIRVEIDLVARTAKATLDLPDSYD